jgi:hypothetical protein
LLITTDGTPAGVVHDSIIAPIMMPEPESRASKRSFHFFGLLIAVLLLGILVANAYAMKSVGRNVAVFYGSCFFPLASGALFLYCAHRYLNWLSGGNVADKYRDMNGVWHLGQLFLVLVLTGCPWTIFVYAVCTAVYGP